MGPDLACRIIGVRAAAECKISLAAFWEFEVMDGIWVHTTPYGSFVMESRWVYDLLTYDLYFQEHLLGSYFQRKSAIQSVMDGSHDAKIGFPGHMAELPDYVTLWSNTLEEPFTDTHTLNTPA